MKLVGRSPGTWVFWLLIAATAAGRLAVAMADHRSLIAQDIYQDDAFYYLKIAENVAAGRGFTFDGQTPTSGFQPLYQLLLVPLAWLTRPSLTAPIRVSALLLAVCAVATGFLVRRLAERIAGPRAGLAALGFWALSPVFVIFGVNGQETGLAILVAVAVLAAWLRLRSDPEPRFPALVTMGALSGLSVLARLDLAILLVAIASDWIWSRFIRRRRGLTARAAAVAVLVAGAVWGSWALASRSLTGEWLPSSGAASRQIALGYGWQNLPRVWSGTPATAGEPTPSPFFAAETVPPGYRLDVATRAGFVFLHDHPMLAALRIGQPFSAWPQLGTYRLYLAFRAAPKAGSAVALILIVAIVLAFRRATRVRADRDANASLPAFARVVTVYVGLLVTLYIWYCPVHWYFSRYFVIAGLLTTVLGVGWISTCASRLPARRLALRTALHIGLVVLIGLQLPHWRLLQRVQWKDARPAGFLATWEAFRSDIPPNARWGAFQAGILSWFSRQDVVNLDGKVNRGAYQAIRDRRLDRYIDEQKIEYVVDWDWVIFALCARHARPEDMERWDLLEREEGGARMSLYRVRTGP